MNLPANHTRALLVSAGVLVSIVGSATASAQTHYFAQNNLLFTFNESSPAGTLSTPLTLTGLGSGADGRVSALAFDPTGTLWGANGAGRFFTIDTSTGATTPKFTTTAGTPIPTFDFRQEGSTLEILASQTSTGGVSNLRKFNAVSGAQIGGDVNLALGTAQNNYAGDVASGYDAVTDKYWIVKGGATAGATEDFSLRSYNYVSHSLSTSVDTGLTWSSAAGAWAGGQLYFGYRAGRDADGNGNWYLPTDPATNDDIYFGRLNTATGAFTQITGAKFDLSIAGAMDPGTTGPSFGYAIAIPEPGTYALLLAGFGLLAFAARRRQS